MGLQRNYDTNNESDNDLVFLEHIKQIPGRIEEEQYKGLGVLKRYSEGYSVVGFYKSLFQKNSTLIELVRKRYYWDLEFFGYNLDNYI